MKNTKSTCLALIAIMLAPLAANAVPITYDVNLTIGAGSVNGTITTDGVLGDLSHTNITGFELTLFDGTDMFFMDNNNGSVTSAGLSPGLFSATATELLFDFALPGTSFLEFEFSEAGEVWSLSFQNGTISEGIALGHFADSGSHEQFDFTVAGLYTIASALPTGVPEPGALALLGLGLAGIRLSRARRKTASI